VEQVQEEVAQVALELIHLVLDHQNAEVFQVVQVLHLQLIAQLMLLVEKVWLIAAQLLLVQQIQEMVETVVEKLHHFLQQTTELTVDQES
tara:strand:- start:175 stop:444 length:270 start_codon:yes stop_codon:yes gene_type:complete